MILALITTAAAAIFPPWTRTENWLNSRVVHDGGFAFLFSAPIGGVDSIQLDTQRLLIERVRIWSVAIAVSLLLRSTARVERQQIRDGPLA